MRKYEFKVVPVPARCDKEARTSGEDPVAHTLEVTLNALAVEGWEFYRTETVTMRKGGFLSFSRPRVSDVIVLRRDRPVMAQRPADLRDEMERLRARKPAKRSEVPALAPPAKGEADIPSPTPRRPRPNLTATA